MASHTPAGSSWRPPELPAGVVDSPLYYPAAPVTVTDAIASGRPLRVAQWGVPDFLIGVFLWLFFSVVAYQIGTSLGDSPVATDAKILIAISLPWIGLAGWPWLVAALKGNGAVIDFGLTFRAADVGWGILFGIITITAALIVAAITTLFFGEFTAAAAEVADGLSLGSLLVFALLVGIGAPIVEELAFRGLLFGALAKRGMAPWLTIVITAAAFSLFHFEPIRIPLLFSTGLILGFARYYRGSTTTAIVAHMTNNLPAAAFLVLMA